MNILSLLTYTSFIIYISFSIYVLYLNKKETINKIFAILSFVLAIWSLSDTFFYTAPNKEIAMIFWRTSTIGWILSPAIMLHLMLSIGKFYQFINRFFKLIIIYLPALILQYLALTTNFYLKDLFLTPYGWADLINPDSIITVSFLIYYCIYSLLSLVVVYKWGKNSTRQEEKKQAAIIFIVSLISLLPAFFTNTMQIAYGTELQIPSFAQIFILIWIGGIMYAIKRYNFLAREEEISILNEKIMLEKKIVSIQSEYIKYQNYILNTMFEYFKNSSSKDIFEFVADKIYHIGGIKILMITEYNSSDSKFILKTIRYENSLEEDFKKLILTNLKTYEAKIPEAEKDFIINKLLSSHIIKLKGGFYEGILRSIDKNIADQFSKKHLLGNAYSIGFSSKDTLYGAATIICEEGKDIENEENLEILINVLSLILQKWYSDIKLRKSEELHRAIFEYSDDCIYILDQNGQILSLSPSFERITGYKTTDFINKSMAEIIHPEDITEAFQMLQNVINGTSSQRSIVRIIDSKKEVLYGEFAATKFTLEDGSPALLGIGRNVTDRIKQEELIKSYQKELELKTTRIETLGLMAVGVLHDLNNILMNISAIIEKIKEKTVSDDTINQYIKDIDHTLTIAKRLSKSLFDISGGKFSENTTDSLKDVIFENLNLLIRDPKYKVITDIQECSKDIAISYSHFTQIFNNLVINAIQAMPNGGTIEVKISEQDIKGNRYIILIVSDTGIGIPKEIQSKIFEPFFTTKPNGTGLGLPTIKSIIKSYGGDIHFSSENGKGTTFTVILPTKEKNNLKPRTFDIDENKRENAAKSILVIDDDSNVREIASDMLNHLGFIAITASNYNEAIKQLKEKKIDTVILDLNLKDSSNVLDSLKEIKQIRQGIKVILCSGSPYDPILTKYPHYGFDGVLTKPFNLRDLKNILK